MLGLVARIRRRPLPAQAAPRVGQVGWLAGCWERKAGQRVVEEQWTRPRGGLMLGAGRTVDGDSLVEFEQVRILERAGHLVYGPGPRDRSRPSSRAS